MPRSLSKEGVRDPLNSENFEFSHSLGQERTFKLCLKPSQPVGSKYNFPQYNFEQKLFINMYLVQLLSPLPSVKFVCKLMKPPS